MIHPISILSLCQDGGILGPRVAQRKNTRGFSVACKINVNRCRDVAEKPVTDGNTKLEAKNSPSLCYSCWFIAEDGFWVPESWG